jgi:hypothetical protein
MKNWLVIISFLMTIEASLLAFAPEDARLAYNGVSLSHELPYVEKGDYLFYRIEWKDSQTDDLDCQEGDDLFAILSALEKYLTPESLMKI